jgi:hypothetical protein
MHNLDTPVWSNAGKRVYHMGKAIRGADASTFEPLLGYYARDAKQIYFGSSVCKKMDRATFRVLNTSFAVDANSAWFCIAPVKQADVQSFRPLDSGLAHNGSNFVSGSFLRAGYAADNKAVWFASGGGVYRLKSADPKTFVSLGNRFGYDHERVYYANKVIEGADRQTWRHWRDMLSVDKDHVYFTDMRIEGVHRPSITLLEAGNCFMDRNRLYSSMKETTSEQYLALLKYREERLAWERTAIADGSIFQRLLMQWPDHC